MCIMNILLRTCLNRLDQFKRRNLTASIIFVSPDLITEFKENISKLTIIAKTNDTRAALSRTSQDVYQFQLIAQFVDTVNLHLIDSVIYCTEIFIIRSRTNTVHMGTEVTLCNTSESCMKYAIHQASKSAVLMSMYNSHLTVMISGNIKILTVNICRKETASHSINIYTVDT